MSGLTGAWARRRYFLVSVAVVLVDQASKLVMHRYLRGRDPVDIVPDFFRLWYSRNPGGLFGSFGDWAGPWRLLLLTILPIAAVVLIATFLARTHASDRPTLFGLSLILGGAVGNLIDRVFRGEVIDFLDVYVAAPQPADWLVSVFGTAHWPTFNIADSSIVVGASLLLICIFRSAPDGAKPSSPPAGVGESL